MNIYDVRSRNRCLLLVVAFVMVLTGCAGYVPRRQAYWDRELIELCEKDGGVTVFETVHISKNKVPGLGWTDGHLGVPPKDLMRGEDVVYSERSETVIRAWNPRVIRGERTVYRRDNGRMVATVVRYSRVGGDFPSPAHPSSFSCPDDLHIFRALDSLYVVEEDKR